MSCCIIRLILARRTANCFVAAGIPRDIVARLNSEINKILQMPDVRERFRNGGVEPVGGTPEKFGEHLHSEIIKWGRVVKESGAKVE